MKEIPLLDCFGTSGLQGDLNGENGFSKTSVAKENARNLSKQWVNLKDSNQTATPELLEQGTRNSLYLAQNSLLGNVRMSPWVLSAYQLAHPL